MSSIYIYIHVVMFFRVVLYLFVLLYMDINYTYPRYNFFLNIFFYSFNFSSVYIFTDRTTQILMVYWLPELFLLCIREQLGEKIVFSRWSVSIMDVRLEIVG